MNMPCIMMIVKSKCVHFDLSSSVKEVLMTLIDRAPFY